MTMLFCIAGMVGAQNAQEPEFVFEPFVLNVQDSTLGSPLPCENAYVKAKAAASMYIVGIGKVKSYSYVEGVSSSLVLSNKDVLVINTGGQSPMQTLSLNKFEILKKKRRFQTGSAGTFTGADANNYEASQDFRYKKYGKSSVVVSLSNLDEGEYCMSITNSNTNSKSSKVYTFSVKNSEAETEQ